MTPQGERQEQPIWGMWDKRAGRFANAHRFQGGMRHDGGLWCIVCQRWERLDGTPLGTSAAR